MVSRGEVVHLKEAMQEDYYYNFLENWELKAGLRDKVESYKRALEY